MKRFTVFLLALALCLGLALPAAAAKPVVVPSPQRLFADGVEIACEKYNIDNSNYFKLRDVAYILSGTDAGFSVGYDPETRLATVTSGEAYEPRGDELALGADNSATARPTNQTIIINGVSAEDLPVYNIGDNNFFKLRDLADALGFTADYDKETNTAFILTGGMAEEPDDETVARWYETGKAAYDAEDYGPAVFWLGRAARADHAEALRLLGLCYYNGCGVPEDPEREVACYEAGTALGSGACSYDLGVCYYYGDSTEQDGETAWAYFLTAAELGYTPAYNACGECCYYGTGREQDYAEAAQWYRKGAEAGDAAAMNNLGTLYDFGEGVEQDYAEAARWYQKAVDLGDVPAMVNLGVLYYNGDGVEGSDEKAAALFRAAAEGGSSVGMSDLAICLEHGYGVMSDIVEALKWYEKAAALGDEEARTRLTGPEALRPAEVSYVLNMNSHKFHDPDCPGVKDIKEENRLDVDLTREEIVELGYAPCGTCKP